MLFHARTESEFAFDTTRLPLYAVDFSRLSSIGVYWTYLDPGLTPGAIATSAASEGFAPVGLVIRVDDVGRASLIFFRRFRRLFFSADLASFIASLGGI